MARQRLALRETITPDSPVPSAYHKAELSPATPAVGIPPRPPPNQHPPPLPLSVIPALPSRHSCALFRHSCVGRNLRGRRRAPGTEHPAAAQRRLGRAVGMLRCAPNAGDRRVPACAGMTRRRAGMTEEGRKDDDKGRRNGEGGANDGEGGVGMTTRGANDGSWARVWGWQSERGRTIAASHPPPNLPPERVSCKTADLAHVRGCRPDRD